MSSQKIIYTGKTKDIYEYSDGNLLIIFKDDVTGENGIADPGSNAVLGEVKGKGKVSLKITDYFFRLFQKENLPTHFISVDLEKNAMIAKKAEMPGHMGALEFVCRKLAFGSFSRRYGKSISEKLLNLNFLVEITLKDDERGDPLINDDAIIALGIYGREDLKTAKALTVQVAKVVDRELLQRGLNLIDMKIELGLVDGKIAVIDEVSPDAMRVMDKDGNILSHEELYNAFFQ